MGLGNLVEGMQVFGAISRLWLKFRGELGQLQVSPGVRGDGWGRGGLEMGFFWGGKRWEEAFFCPGTVSFAADTPFADLPGREIRGGQKFIFSPCFSPRASCPCSFIPCCRKLTCARRFLYSFSQRNVLHFYLHLFPFSMFHRVCVPPRN